MRRVIFTPSLWTHSFTNYLRFPLQLSSFCGGPNAGAQGARWRSGGRQMMALVWFRRAEVCLHLPGRPMAPGQPARAPIPPSLAVCAERPFGFHALTVWISRRRSMTWAIGDLCRFSLLNLGSLGRFFAQNFVLSALSAFRHLRLPCLSLCARGVTGQSPNAQCWRRWALIRSMGFFDGLLNCRD